MEQYFIQNELFLRLVAAVFLGIMLGAERNFAHKGAGMRTYGLVSLGSAIFVVGSLAAAAQYIGIASFDPLRVASQVVVGVGFLGGGLIVVRNGDLNNVTTAAGLWVAAGIGMLCGFGLYWLALFSTLLTLFVFTVLWFLEQKVKHVSSIMHDGTIKRVLEEDKKKIKG